MENHVLYNGDKISILGVSDWITVDKIPTAASKAGEKLVENHGSSGCYQFALVEDIDEIGDSLIHEKLKYIGYSDNIVGRTYEARANGSYGPSRVRRDLGLDRNQICVRYIYCPEGQAEDFEKYLFEQMLETYGYRFGWDEASAGRSGNKSNVIHLANKLSYDELLDIIPTVKEIARTKAIEKVEQELEEL